MTAPLTADPVKQLRGELKEWEKAFAAAHGGRKAAREDIKQDAVIAQKYKHYNRLSGRVAPKDAAGCAGASKRCREEGDADADADADAEEQQQQQVQKRPRQLHAADLDPYDVPLQRTPTAVRTSIGPTPQKNGQVLGLFDLFSPNKEAAATPSRPRALQGPAALGLTPTRTRLHDLPLVPGCNPSSAAGTPRKTVMERLSDYLTPSAPRFRVDAKPGSGRSLPDDTPAFLRRTSFRVPNVQDGQSCEGADALSLSPVAVRLPPRPVGKGLSALVQGLKYIEDERLDSDLDLLHEMEAEESGGVAIPKKAAVLVEDSQMIEEPDLPLGADGEAPESESDELTQTAEGESRRSWKKRGQKRTTKKANIVPSTAKWKPEPEWNPRKESQGEAAQAGDEAAKAAPRRKISATAHANFRALKIRSKYGKGKTGGFRGRRR